MFLKLVLLFIIIVILYKSNEPMKCNDVKINKPPVSSIYDVTYNMESNKYENKIFDEEYTVYKSSLKKYFNDLKKYCTIN